MNNMEVDAKQVLYMFADLTGKEQKKAYRNALRKAANILAKETKRRLKSSLGRAANHKNWWNKRTMISGVRAKTNREGTESKVHIMGDFRLKFFEMGTKLRRTTGHNNSAVRGRDPEHRQKKAANRGSIKAFHFFKSAKDDKEKEIFSSLNGLISQSIQNIANKHRG